MSTTNTQTNTGTFNQAGMGAYNQMTPAFSNAATGYINNPFSNPFFQTQQQMGYQQADTQNQSNMSSLTRNIGMSGIGQNSPAALEMMNNQRRAGTNLRSNLGFLNPMQNAFTAQQNAMGMAGQYRPLQTGGTQTQKQGGLGQFASLLGMGVGALTGGLFGGGGGNQPQQQSNQQMSNVWGSGAMTNMSTGMGNFGQYGGGTSMGQNAPNTGGYNFGQSPFMMGQPQQPQGY
jgi:hypothetical protein